MLKIMIVDDEFIVRVGIQSCIDWEANGCRIIASCESAKEAIRQFEQVIPDIVFTDIIMPEMDGIALVEYIRRHFPKTRIVVLSCMNEIEYVKKAMKLGAEDYILKLSFTRDTMAELIRRMKASIEEERKKAGEEERGIEIQAYKREEDLRILVTEKTFPEDLTHLLERLGYQYDTFLSYQAGCLILDNQSRLDFSEDPDSYIRKYGLLNTIREYFESLPPFELSFTDEYEIMVLFVLEENDNAEPYFPDLLYALNDGLKTHMNLTLSMGISSRIRNRLELPNAYKEARKRAELRFFDGTGSFHGNSEQKKGTVLVPDRKMQKKLGEAVFKQDREEAYQLMEDWFVQLSFAKENRQIRVIRRLVVEAYIFLAGYTRLEGEQEYDDSGCMELFWRAETLEQLKNCLKKAVDTRISQLCELKHISPEISGLLAWLEENVGETISLEQAAGYCGWGKSQFSILFKKATGETFVNYFNGLKMKKVFALLSSSNIQVQEAADCIGIRDISYFSRLFKRYYKISPSDVRKI